MNTYEHTQRGTLIINVLLGGFSLLAVIFLTVFRDEPTAGLICASVAVTLLVFAWLFGSLCVCVTPGRIALRFGPGLFRKNFATADVVDAEVVRNRWYYGWGIKWTPHGWLYNVSGLDAVEIKLRSGRKYRIGTDEPEKLRSAIADQLG